MKPLLPALLLGLGLSTASVTPAAAYPVDCAILLCLAGGWPASAECSHARVVFIARITPWPVEPPLQIWNCPMRTSLWIVPGRQPAERLQEIRFHQPSPAQPFATAAAPATFPPGQDPSGPPDFDFATAEQPANVPATRHARLQLAQAPASGGADVDISGPAFDFVRSIKVWHIEYRHHENRNGDCVETERALLGSYGPQGDYRWVQNSAHAAPTWMGIDRACTRSGGFYRGVGVEWLDSQGRSGHEVVRY